MLLPFVTAFLLILTFYPFGFWPLGFIAWVPFLFFLYRERSVRRAALGGCIVGAVTALALSFTVTEGFTWVPQAHLFQTLIRLLPIIAALTTALLYGAAFALLRKIFPEKSAAILVVFPAIGALFEMIWTSLSQGYFFFDMAYAVSASPFLMSFASIGGVYLVSFIVYITNSFAAAFVIALWEERVPPYKSLQRIGAWFAAFFAVLMIMYILNAQYLRSDGPIERVSFAIIQNNDRHIKDLTGVFDASDTYSYPTLSNAVATARGVRPDIIIYPFYLTDTLLTGSATSMRWGRAEPLASVGAWVASTTAGTTFINWNNIVRDSDVYNEIDMWKGGEIVASYKKEHPFPFADYTPQWSQDAGFYTTSADVAVGENSEPMRYRDLAIKGSICSEINQPETFKQTSGEQIILSIGSDSMFGTDIASEDAITAAQFRAVENNRPVVRADRFGPSAFIAQSGAIIAEQPFNTSGTLYQSFWIQKEPKRAIYSYAGNWLVGAVMIVTIFVAWFTRKNPV